MKKSDHIDTGSAGLTVEVLLLGADHLLGGGLADALGEALAGQAVPSRQQPVVYRLPRHVPLSLSLLLAAAAAALRFLSSGSARLYHC